MAHRRCGRSPKTSVLSPPRQETASIARERIAISVGIAELGGLNAMGDPRLPIVAHGSDEADLFRGSEIISEKGWTPGHRATD